MYPRSELEALAETKLLIQRRIARRRTETAEYAVQATRPLEWIDLARAQWQRYAPFIKLAAGPLSFFAFRSYRRRGKLLGQVLRWAPAIWGVFKNFRRAQMRPDEE